MRKINNFNSVMAILAGINTASCHRLKFTREGLSQKSRDVRNYITYIEYKYSLYEYNFIDFKRTI